MLLMLLMHAPLLLLLLLLRKNVGTTQSRVHVSRGRRRDTVARLPCCLTCRTA